jgi:hypothetical protein
VATLTYRVVQRWGRDRARQATVISIHATAEEAFAEIDRLSAQMVRTGDRPDAVELIMVDDTGNVVPAVALIVPNCGGTLRHAAAGERAEGESGTSRHA